MMIFSIIYAIIKKCTLLKISIVAEGFLGLLY